MAVGTRNAEDRRIVGSFKITGDESNRRITLSKKLEGYDFPIELGEEVVAELVEYEDKPNRLELTPSGGGE